MTDTEDVAKAPVKDLADAFGKQSKYSNQLWLALIAAAIVVNFPNDAKSGKIELPFSLGAVDGEVFAPAAFLILAVLTVAYCVAFAEAQNASRFAHQKLDKLRSFEERRLFDLLSVATFARVAPLVYLLRSLFREHKEVANKISALYYVILKVVSNTVLLGIPIVSLVTAYLKLDRDSSISTIALWVNRFSALTLTMTGSALILIIAAELRHDSRVAKLYWTGALRE